MLWLLMLSHGHCRRFLHIGIGSHTSGHRHCHAARNWHWHRIDCHLVHALGHPAKSRERSLVNYGLGHDNRCGLVNNRLSLLVLIIGTFASVLLSLPTFVIGATVVLIAASISLLLVALVVARTARFVRHLTGLGLTILHICSSLLVSWVVVVLSSLSFISVLGSVIWAPLTLALGSVGHRHWHLTTSAARARRSSRLVHSVLPVRLVTLAVMLLLRIRIVGGSVVVHHLLGVIGQHLGEVAVLRRLLHPILLALVKVDLNELAELFLKVESLHSFCGFVSRCIIDHSSAAREVNAGSVCSHQQVECLNVAIFCTNFFYLFLSQLNSHIKKGVSKSIRLIT